MIKCFWFHFLLLCAFFFTASALINHLHLPAIIIHSNQTERSCAYTVIIKTSCSSIPYTTDKVSLAFGDAYGSEVYVSRIDEPQTRTFERCSKYVFEVRGPCLDMICFIELMRNGSDGWKPESVLIYGRDFGTILHIDTFLLDEKWFGATYCSATSDFAFRIFAFF